MLPIRKILCTTDFSDPSYKGIRRADELARHFDAELIAVHVTHPIPVPVASDSVLLAHSFDIDEHRRVMEAHAIKYLDAAIESACAHADAVRRVLRHGNPADEIVALAVEAGVDLIVISTHGHTGLHRMLLGSVTERVVRTAPCPVLTVHMGEEGERAAPCFDLPRPSAG